MTHPYDHRCACLWCRLQSENIDASVALSHAPDCVCSVCLRAKAAVLKQRVREGIARSLKEDTMSDPVEGTSKEGKG